MAELMSLALDELLETARLATVSRWSDHAYERGFDLPIFALSRAEVALRHGRHSEAIAHAELAAATDDALRFRSLSLAGRAGHLASREEQALAAYERAEAVATSESEVQDAKWGQLMCAIELEAPHAEQWLRELDAGVRPGEPREIVRAAAIGLSFQVKLGDLDLTDADSAAGLVPFVDDPLVTSAFQSTYSAMLGLAARYAEARAVVDASSRRSSATGSISRLPTRCALTLSRAPVSANGLMLSQALGVRLTVLLRAHDGHAQQLCVSQLTRVLIQQGKHLEALDLEIPVVRKPLMSIQAEAISSRALALASLGQVERARELVGTVSGVSKAVEPAVLIAATNAVCALKMHEPDAVDRVIELEETAFRRGGLDLLVTAYRSTPELLAVLLRASKHGEHVRSLVRRAGDADLADFLGHPVSATSGPRQKLSPRERDVYDSDDPGSHESRDSKVAVHRGVDSKGARAPHLRQARCAFANSAWLRRRCSNGPIRLRLRLSRARLTTSSS